MSIAEVLKQSKPSVEVYSSYDHKIASIAFFEVCDRMLKHGLITNAEHAELVK